MVTIKDVARAAGVSVSTVSLVLNSTLENTRTAPETWRKVRSVMEELDYRPSSTARKLRKSERSRASVGLLWPLEFNYTALGETVVRLQQAFDNAGFECTFTVYTFCNKRLAAAMAQAKEELMDGLIIAMPDIEDMQWLETHSAEHHVVLFGRQLPQYSFVRADNHLAGRLAAEPFKNLEGGQVAVFYYDRLVHDVRKQLETFNTQCRMYGVGLRYYTLNRQPDNTRNILDANERMLADGLPQAVVYFTGDRTAYTSLFDLMDRGITVPQQLKALQVNMLFGQLPIPIRPSLTHIICDTQAMLTECASILCSSLSGQSCLEQKIYVPSIIYRDTFPEPQTQVSLHS